MKHFIGKSPKIAAIISFGDIHRIHDSILDVLVGPLLNN